MCTRNRIAKIIVTTVTIAIHMNSTRKNPEITIVLEVILATVTTVKEITNWTQYPPGLQPRNEKAFKIEGSHVEWFFLLSAFKIVGTLQISIFPFFLIDFLCFFFVFALFYDFICFLCFFKWIFVGLAAFVLFKWKQLFYNSCLFNDAHNTGCYFWDVCYSGNFCV
jgi:hypothetical protein